MISSEDLVVSKLISFRERSDIPDLIDVMKNNRKSMDWRYIKAEAKRYGALRKLNMILRKL